MPKLTLTVGVNDISFMGIFIRNDVVIVVFESRVFEKSVNIVTAKVELSHFMRAFDGCQQAFFLQKIGKNGMK